MRVEDVLKESRAPEQLVLTYAPSFSESEIKLACDPLLEDFFRLILALHYIERNEKGVDELSLATPYVEELKSIAGRLEGLYHFLTRTSISLRFEKRSNQRQDRFSEPQHGPDVLLFSGGLDSFCGAVNHTSRTLLAHGILNNIVFGRSRLLRMACPTLRRIPMVSCRCIYEGLGGGFSQTRGLLFLSLAGLASSTLGSKTVTLSENGPLMLNPETSPLSPPTKNADPRLVMETESIIRELRGEDFQIACPSKNMTKSESVAMTPLRFYSLFPSTSSCASTHLPKMCGICFGCFVRRLSLAAIEYVEHDAYSFDFFADDLGVLRERRARRILDLQQSLRYFEKFVTHNSAIVDPYAVRFFEDPTSLIRKFSLDLILGLSNLIKLHPSYESANAFGRFCNSLVQRTNRELIDQRRAELSQILASQDRSSIVSMENMPLSEWAGDS